MRYVRFVLVPGEDGFHPIERRVRSEPDITPTKLLNINLLDDETAVILFEVKGDPDRMYEIAESSEGVHDYQISEGEERTTIYAHFEPRETIRELLSLVQNNEVILDLPLEYTDRGGVRVLLVGDEGTIRELMPKVPEEIRLKLERTGEYAPEATRLYSLLTERQKTTLQTALEAGYYENPKQATQQEVAQRLDRSDGTVGEHLRKIEKKILSAVAP